MPRLRLAGTGVKKSKKKKKAQVCQLLFAPLFHINGKQRAKVNKTNTENTEAEATGVCFERSCSNYRRICRNLPRTFSCRAKEELVQ